VVDVDRPVCFWCARQDRPMPERTVHPADAVFESLCGHDQCPSMVFHGLCLMEFRADERYQTLRDRNNAFIAWLRGEA
jgi:hypothetical protein